MSSYRAVAFSGVFAVIVAVALIVVALFIPEIGLSNVSKPVATSASESNLGTLSVMLTDPPPILPENVSAVYITYSDVQVQVAGSNLLGWYNLNGSGQLDLLSIENVSQTIANASLGPETFNILRFNVTGITITYDNQSYPGQIIYGQNMISVPIEGISVSAAETTFAMIDLTPTVILAGAISNPTFVFIPSARGYLMPTTIVPTQSHQIGSRVNLVSSTIAPWWAAVEEGISFGITGVFLTNNSLSISVTNNGTTPVDLRLVGITNQVSAPRGQTGLLLTSDVFVALSNGTLVQMVAPNSTAAGAQITGGGVLIAPGHSITLTYNGEIWIGMQVLISGAQIPIIPGASYLVWVQGDSTVAQYGPITAGPNS